MHNDSSFPISSSGLVVTFEDCYSDQKEMESQSILICISLVANDVEHIFEVLIGHLYFFC